MSVLNNLFEPNDINSENQIRREARQNLKNERERNCEEIKDIKKISEMLNMSAHAEKFKKELVEKTLLLASREYNEEQFKNFISSQPQEIRQIMEEILQSNNQENLNATNPPIDVNYSNLSQDDFLKRKGDVKDYARYIKKNTKIEFVKNFLDEKGLLYFVECDRQTKFPYVKFNVNKYSNDTGLCTEKYVILVSNNGDEGIAVFKGDNFQAMPIDEITKNGGVIVSASNTAKEELEKIVFPEVVAKKEEWEKEYNEIKKDLEYIDKGTVELKGDNLEDYKRELKKYYELILQRVNRIKWLHEKLNYPETELEFIQKIEKDFEKRCTLNARNEALLQYASDRDMIGRYQGDDLTEVMNAIIHYEFLRHIYELDIDETKKFMSQYQCVEPNVMLATGIVFDAFKGNIVDKEWSDNIIGDVSKDNFSGDNLLNAFKIYSEWLCSHMDLKHKPNQSEYLSMHFAQYAICRALEVYEDKTSSKEKIEKAKKMADFCIANSDVTSWGERSKQITAGLIKSAIIKALEYEDTDMLWFALNEKIYEGTDKKDTYIIIKDVLSEISKCFVLELQKENKEKFKKVTRGIFELYEKYKPEKVSKRDDAIHKIAMLKKIVSE